MNRKPIFDAVRRLIGRKFTQSEVTALDRAIDMATGALGASTEPEPSAPLPTATGHSYSLGAAGETLVKKWEGCSRARADGKFDAYPDPGSRDGNPWTIGWGSTGSDIKRGVIWTKAQCDARFTTSMQRYVDQVAKAVGNAPTSPAQFDALVSFHYNTGAIARATLTKKHIARDYSGAAKEFGKWVNNNGKPMKGLINRRREEAKLYASG